MSQSIWVYFFISVYKNEIIKFQFYTYKYDPKKKIT